MRGLLRRIAWDDVGVVIGTGFVVAGCWRVSEAAALIVIGVTLLWVALPPRAPFVRK